MVTKAVSLMWCVLCGRRWDDPAERWRLVARRGETRLYCPHCDDR